MPNREGTRRDQGVHRIHGKLVVIPTFTFLGKRPVEVLKPKSFGVGKVPRLLGRNLSNAGEVTQDIQPDVAGDLTDQPGRGIFLVFGREPLRDVEELVLKTSRKTLLLRPRRSDCEPIPCWLRRELLPEEAFQRRSEKGGVPAHAARKLDTVSADEPVDADHHGMNDRSSFLFSAFLAHFAFSYLREMAASL